MSIINALKNPSFSNGLDFWNVSNTANIATQAFGGVSNGACILVNAVSQTSLRQYIPLLSGNYEVHAKVKKVSGTPDMWIQVQCNGTTFNSPSSINILSEDEFTDISLCFSHNSSSWQYAAVFFICSGGEIILDETELDAEDGKVLNLLKYGTIILTDSKIRQNPNQTSSVIAYAPLNRKMLVRETDDYEWLTCRCKLKDSPYAGVGYIKRSCLGTLSNAHYPEDYNADSVEGKIYAIGAAEMSIVVGQYDRREYYSKNLNQGLWCHYFADWISTVCFWGDLTEAENNVPFKSNCRTGIRWFLENGAFSFATAAQKQKLRAFNDFSSLISSDLLTSAELNYSPDVGDYVYFASDNSTEASQHVAVVVNTYSDGRITIVEGNYSNQYPVNMRTIDPQIGGSGNVVGFGRPPYYAHG